MKEKVFELLKRLTLWKLGDRKVKGEYEHLGALRVPIGEVGGVKKEWRQV